MCLGKIVNSIGSNVDPRGTPDSMRLLGNPVHDGLESLVLGVRSDGLKNVNRKVAILHLQQQPLATDLSPPLDS
ncbi:hypothetical protein Trydic_g6409 [Trypoxylus dichotomus]